MVTKDDGVVERNRKLFLSLRVWESGVGSLRVMSRGSGSQNDG